MKLKLLTFAVVSCSLIFSATSLAARDLSQKIDDQSPFSSLEKYKKITRNTYINKKNTNAMKFGLKGDEISVVGFYVTKENELGFWITRDCKLDNKALTCIYSTSSHYTGSITFKGKSTKAVISDHVPTSRNKSHRTVWLKVSDYDKVT